MIKQWKRGVKLETMRIVEWVWYYILGLKRSISKHGEVLDIPQTYYITDIVQTLWQCLKNDSEKSKHKFHKPKIKKWNDNSCEALVKGQRGPDYI